MDTAAILVEPSELSAMCKTALERAGLGTADAALVADTLVDADSRGVYSHGVVRLRDYVGRLLAGGMRPAGNVTIVGGRSPFVLVDGVNGVGQVVSTNAMRMAIGFASDSGIGCVGVRRSNHFGSASYYTRLASRQGKIGIAFTNTSPVIAPYGGRDVLLGNNPWSIAVPSRAGAPLVLDIANTVAARGKIRAAAARGEPIPTGWALDRRGLPTTDAAEALAGLIQPIGGHKGYGIAFMVDVLAGVLTGAAFGPDVGSPREQSSSGPNVGHLFLAIDVAYVTPLDSFFDRVDALVGMLKASAPLNGTIEIFVPGEPEHVTATERAAQVPLGSESWESLEEVSRLVGVELPRYRNGG